MINLIRISRFLGQNFDQLCLPQNTRKRNACVSGEPSIEIAISGRRWQGQLGEVVFKCPIVAILCWSRNEAFAKQGHRMLKFFESKGNPPVNIVRVYRTQANSFAIQIFFVIFETDCLNGVVLLPYKVT